MTDKSSDLARALAGLAHADLASLLTAEPEPDSLLEHVLAWAAELIPGADQAGIAAAAGHPALPLPLPGVLIQAVVNADTEHGEGPVHDALQTGATVRVDDLTSDPRWPRYAARLAGLGPASLLVCPLPDGHGPHGALIACASRPGAFAPAAERVAPNVAGLVAMALAHAERIQPLRQAITVQTTIGQACGILIERHKLTSEQALDTLTRAASLQGLSILEAATRLVESCQQPNPTPEQQQTNSATEA